MAYGDMTINQYDGPTADESVLRAAYVLMEAEDRELRPEIPPLAWDEFLGLQRSTIGTEDRLYWLVTDADRPVARAALRLPTAHNQHLAIVEEYVHVDWRGKGIGTALARVVIDAIAAAGRVDLVAHTNDGHPAERFLERLGATRGSSERISRLDLQALDRELMDAWLRDGEATDGYSLVEWQRRCPDDLVERFVVVKAAMNNAPVDDLPIGDRVHTVSSVRESEAELIDAHLERWTIAAVHDATGELAGFTEMTFADSAPENAWQGGTAVVPHHRGHGLGRWMKAAMATAVLERRPAVRWVDTENAYSNGPMLAINVAMGFEVIRTTNGWTAKVDEVRRALHDLPATSS